MNKIYIFVKLFVFIFITFIIVNLSFYVYAFITPKMQLKTANNVEYYDNENILAFNNVEGRKWVKLKDTSSKIIDSTIIVEDKNFYNHKGFDYFRIVKALCTNLFTGELKQGASTISQQYIKNLFLDFDKTWSRKIEEAKLTFELETHYSKKDILEGYLNTINYGNGAYGIENASYYYFNKPSKSLSWAEASFISGIPKNPTYYNPIINYDNAKKRQKEVLYSLMKNKKISNKEFNKIFNEKINLYGKDNESKLNSVYYYKDAVLKELQGLPNVPKNLINTGGLKIYTNLITKKQEAIESIIKEELINEDDLQAASMLINPKNGKIEALIGGKNYNYSQFNRAINAYRQVGSTMKSFLYYSALENGLTSSSLFRSEASTFNLGNNKTYTPKNYGNMYANKDITLAEALVLSDNIYAVKTHLFLGKDKLIDTARRSGIESELPNVASLPLGTHELSMIDYASGFTTLANEGKKNKPYLIRKITDINDNLIYEHKQKEEYVLNSRYVYILNELMSNTYNYNFIDYTTPTMLGIKSLLTKKYAIKSGSTNTDYWTIGYNPNALLLVWNGFDDNKEVKIKQSLVNKKIWARSIESALKDEPDTWYPIANKVVGSIVNPVNGKIDNSKNQSMLFYVKGTEPSFEESILNNIKKE
ncbi:MAG: transglycosylase domain-containing protein [Bacilli bacterium]